MQHIKFRAWNDVEEEMIYFGEMKIDSENKGLICYWEADTNSIITTVMQFIWLHDKNGVEIYDGDIIRNNSELWIVEWWGECACWSLVNIHNPYNRFSFLTEKAEHHDVIGNIHQNLELL